LKRHDRRSEPHCCPTVTALQAAVIHAILPSLKRLLLLIPLACVLGCGGSSDGGQLADTAWTMRVPGLICDHQTSFYKDGRYLDTIECQLPDDSHVVEINRGNYSVDGHTVLIAVKESSCPMATSGEFDFGFSVDGLVLATGTGDTVTLTRLLFLPGEPQGLPIGCFDASDWAFTPMAIHAL